jgi:WD40 repeat protein
MNIKNIDYSPIKLGSFALTSAMYISRTGKDLAIGTTSGKVNYVDLSTGMRVWKKGGHKDGGATGDSIYGIVITPDGKTIISASTADQTLVKWDVASKEKVFKLKTKKIAPNKTRVFTPRFLHEC